MTSPGASRWNAPPVVCWVCGNEQVPAVRVTATLPAVAFWAIPHHPAFAVQPGHRVPACSGGGRLLGPVRTP